MKTINLVLADDHLMVIEGLKAMLKNESSLNIQAALNSGAEVLKYFEDNPVPDILILDINMPGMDGIELTAYLKKAYPSLKILILSMYNRNEFVSQLSQLGADGYIMKNSDKSTILAAIQSLGRGRKYFSPHLQAHDLVGQAEADILDVELSDREKQVVKMVTQGYNSNEIADALHLSPYTIDTHRRRILIKIHGSNTADIIRFAIKTGIVKDYRL